jgi:microsomal dipeptidase-like Zn-dependent dipeptidase
MAPRLLASRAVSVPDDSALYGRFSGDHVWPLLGDHRGFVKGFENPTEASINILRWLVKAGYTEGDIQKVIGGNALRVLKQVWK